MARPMITVDVESVRQMYEQGIPVSSIAKTLGVSPETVRKRMEAAGLMRRAPGRPRFDVNRPVCKNGHFLDGRNKYVSPDGGVFCRRCRNEQNRNHYKRIREAQLDAIKKTPELYAAKTVSQRLLRRRMSIAEYQTQFDKQQGLCALCGLPETETFRGKIRMLAVDHDHDTGLNRGLLCRRCNCVLGMLNDDVTLFQRAIEYLGKWRQECSAASS